METATPVKIKIVSRWNNDRVIFECDVPEGLESGLHMRHALEKAIASGSNLSDCNLSGSDLSDCNLSGCDLSGSNLSGSDLSDCNLSDCNLSGCDLSDCNLSDCNLRGCDLSDFRQDFWDVLLRAPSEITGVRAALTEGRVDGSTYSGECACLIGTIGNIRHQSHDELGNGLSPDSGRPAEQWFMGIKKGDTPETNTQSALAVKWLDELTGLLALARSVPA